MPVSAAPPTRCCHAAMPNVARSLKTTRISSGIGKGILVRFDEQTRLADREQIERLFLENERLKREGAEEFYNFINSRLPKEKGFDWVSLGLNLPLRRFGEQLPWDSARITKFQKAVAWRGVGDELTWTGRYHPDSHSGLDERKEFGIQLQRGRDYVNFTPSVKVDVGSNWFQIHFDAHGRLLVTVGFLEGTKLPIENVWDAFYAIADLFVQEEIKDCYPNCLWDAGEFQIYYQIMIH